MVNTSSSHLWREEEWGLRVLGGDVVAWLGGASGGVAWCWWSYSPGCSTCGERACVPHTEQGAEGWPGRCFTKHQRPLSES